MLVFQKSLALFTEHASNGPQLHVATNVMTSKNFLVIQIFFGVVSFSATALVVLFTESRTDLPHRILNNCFGSQQGLPRLSSIVLTCGRWLGPWVAAPAHRCHQMTTSSGKAWYRLPCAQALCVQPSQPLGPGALCGWLVDVMSMGWGPPPKPCDRNVHRTVFQLSPPTTRLQTVNDTTAFASAVLFVTLSVHCQQIVRCYGPEFCTLQPLLVHQGLFVF